MGCMEGRKLQGALGIISCNPDLGQASEASGMSPPLHFKGGEPENTRKSPYVGEPRIPTQREPSSEVHTSEPVTLAHWDSNVYAFCVIPDNLQEPCTHQEGPWGKGRQGTRNER